MNATRLSGLSGEAQRAAARSAAYGCFVGVVAYPDQEQLEAIRSGAVAGQLAQALTAVAPGLLSKSDLDALRDAGRDDELAIEYTRLFDVGAGGPPCPLHGGLYRGARMQVMEEAVRFYNFFGLHMPETPAELPDHLTTQLEFLHYLAFREAEALQQGDDPAPYRRAQRDFVARHPGSWVPALCVRLEKQEPARFFSALFAALDRFLARDLQELLRAAGPPPPEARRAAS